MQHEPGGGFGMLGVDRQHASRKMFEPGTKSGYFKASDEVGGKGRNREEVYGFVSETLREQHYHELKRCSRWLLRRYLTKMTGLSRAQITRLVSMYLEGDPVQPKSYRRNCFAKRYSKEDIVLLAAVDEVHETRSGPATRKLLQRAYYEFKESKYQRLAELSVAQMYRLRKTHTYRHERVTYQSTRPTQVAIGEWRRPEPEERPGYLRSQGSAQWIRFTRGIEPE